MSRIIELAPGAEENGFASMLATLIQQNIEDHPDKGETFDRMVGRVAIVIEDLRIAITLLFEGGRLVVLDGISGVPDLTMRTDSELVMKTSLIELDPRFALPDPRGAVAREVFSASLKGDLITHGALTNLALMIRLTRLMSVN